MVPRDGREYEPTPSGKPNAKRAKGKGAKGTHGSNNRNSLHSPDTGGMMINPLAVDPMHVNRNNATIMGERTRSNDGDYLEVGGANDNGSTGNPKKSNHSGSRAIANKRATPAKTPAKPKTPNNGRPAHACVRVR